MQNFIRLLFFTTLSQELIKNIPGLRTPFALIPELLSLIALFLVIAYASQRKKISVPALYWALFVLFILTVTSSAIANGISSGTYLSGLRNYLKYFPLFLVPAVYRFSDIELKQQFQLILAFGIIQLPVTLFQRLVLFSNVATGDPISGTLKGSGILTIFQVCLITMLFSFYLRGRVTRTFFLSLFFILLVPTAINETKVTIFLLPMAIALPFLMDKSGNRSHRFGMLAFSGFGFLALFVPIYDYFLSASKEWGILDFISDPTLMQKYLAPYTSGLRTEGRIGRIDALILAYQELSKEYPTTMLGLGIGSVSSSQLGQWFTGENYLQYGELIYASYSRLMWEVGFLGIIILITFAASVWRDAMYLANAPTMVGALALGISCLVCIYMLMLAYANVIGSDALSFGFWYFCGLIVSRSHDERGRTKMNHY